MNSKSLKLVYSFTMPGGFLLASAVALTRFPVLPASASQIFLWLPYAVFAIGALLSWRFNRSRVLMAMVAMAVVYAAIVFYVFQQTANPDAATTILAAVALLLPINLALFSMMQERGFFGAAVTPFVALNAVSQGRAPGLYFTTAGLILVVSLIEMSYHMAFLDELTGLPGRRAFNEAALKLGDNYSVAMVDVDHFKQFNDTHGPECSDQVL